MRSEGSAIDEAGMCAFGQAGFGRWGVGAYAHTSNTSATPAQAFDPQSVRVLELGTAVHWYAVAEKGIAVGPTAWIGGMFGYSTEGPPLEKKAFATWGVGARFGGYGSWAQVGYGDSEAVGPNAFQVLGHIQTTDHTAIGGHLESAGGKTWRVAIRICAGWTRTKQ